MMIKVSNTSGFSSWPQVLDLGKAGEEQVTSRRAAPSEPLAFCEGHECGERVYTNGADRDLIVAPKFCTTVFELLGGSCKLDYARLNWNDDDIKAADFAKFK